MFISNVSNSKQQNESKIYAVRYEKQNYAIYFNMHIILNFVTVFSTKIK